MKGSMAIRDLAEIGIDGWSSRSECERCSIRYASFTETTFQPLSLSLAKTFRTVESRLFPVREINENSRFRLS